MSLINDALKRAAESQKQNPSDSPPKVPLQPVNYAAPPSAFYRLLALLALLALLGVSVWALSKWWNSSRENKESASSGSAIAPQRDPLAQVPGESTVSTEPRAQRTSIKVSTSIVMRSETVVAPEAAARLPVTAATTTNMEIQGAESSSLETNLAVAVTNAPPTFPELRLQSIIYRLNKPAVVINGEMLYVGEVIKDARVVRIERYAVTVVWRGETNVLSLPRL